MSRISIESTEDRKSAHRLDDEIVLLPGWPGYRTRPGRSGLDYIDTQLELAHMAGIFLRKLVTNTWRHSGFGPHPLVTLTVGIMLWVAFPGNAPVCLGIIAVLLIALVTAIRNHNKNGLIQTTEELSSTVEDEDLALLDNTDPEDSEKKG